MPRAKVKPGTKYRVVSPDGGLGHIVLEGVTLNVSQEELDAFPDKLESIAPDPTEEPSFYPVRTIVPEEPILIDTRVDEGDESVILVDENDEPILVDEDDGPVLAHATIAAYAAAEEAGIDINDVNGTGSDGRITKADVDEYVSEG